MKLKGLSILMVTVMLFTSVFGSLSITTAKEMDIIVKVDSQVLSFDQPPVLINDRTMVPLRAIFEKLGATVNWEEATSTITANKDGTKIVLQIGNTTSYINDAPKTLDSPPVVINDRTLVPVRFISEALGCSVEWDEISQIVSIKKGNAPNTPAATPGVAKPESTKEIEVLEDAFVKNGDSETKNFGSDKRLELKETTDANYGRKAYLKFDASSITDADITSAVVSLFVVNMEAPDKPTNVIAYSIDNEKWSESQITYKNAPKKLDKLGQKAMKGQSSYQEIDITNYVKTKLTGDKIISICVSGDSAQKLRIDFDSKEGAHNPILKLKYGGTSAVQPQPTTSALPTVPGFGNGVDPIAYAKKMVTESTATGSKQIGSSGTTPVKVSDTEIHYPLTESSYVRSGANASKNFAGEANLCIKGTDDPDMARRTYLKYNLSDLGKSSVGGAYLKVYNTMLEQGDAVDITALKVADNSWTEKGITWSNAPKTSGAINKVTIKAQNQWYYIDLTTYINEKLADDKIASLTLEDTNKKNRRIEFENRGMSRAPTLVLLSPGAPAGSVPIPTVAQAPEKADDYNYITVGVNKNKAPRTSFEPMKTRVLESLPGFKISTTKPALSKYGGLLSKKQNATGFFYATKIGDRWWMVDPEGYQTINMGIVALGPGSTPNEKIGQQKAYGSDDAWAKGITSLVRDDLGFNSTGAWSNDPLLKTVPNPITYTKLFYFLVGYGDYLGTSVQQSGHKGFVNDTMPVFDPDFEIFSDKLAAENMPKLKDDPYLVGYYSDNELPTTINMLNNYLSLDPSDPLNAYSYATAWEWFRARRGQNATISDITGTDRDDFREFVYDRYYAVVTKAIKKYDPNHMYLGSRVHSEAKTSAGIQRAAGRYCDVVSLNYYSTWTPDQKNMAEWYEWSGKPVLITEWYVKGMDSGLANTSGAGWVVATQKDRGAFYQHFALGLLESKSCVGWHWFKYKDNDPNAPASDPSNIDGNKGIINTDFKLYTDLTNEMREFNYNTYNLIDYLDSTSK